MSPRKILGWMVRLAVTCVLLFSLFRSVDPVRLRHQLEHLNRLHLLLLVSVAWVGQAICAQRWRILAESLGMRNRFWSYLQMYFGGMLFNIGLPSLVGGDAIKAYVASRRSGKPLVLGLASVLQDRAAGLIALLAYGSAAALAVGYRWRGIPLLTGYGLAWAGISVFFLLIWKGDRLYRPFLAEKTATLTWKLARTAADFHQCLVVMRITTSGVVQVAGLSFLNSAIVLWMYHQVCIAAGAPVDLVGFASLFPLIGLLTMLPISLGGIGIREWAYVEGLALMGVTADQALLIALSTSAIVIAINLGGLFFLPTIPSQFRRARIRNENGQS